MHTRFKLKIGIEIEPEPMELPECKAGSAIGKCKTGSRKKERKKSSEMCGQMCAGNLKLGSVSFQRFFEMGNKEKRIIADRKE